ncbi:MAG: 3-hydroxyacyl-ACP dehydratase [Agriterribacter sp.]
MLNNDFFYISSVKNDEQNIMAELHLNPEHHIFQGHFPGQPVVPGVCQVQMVKEILEIVLGKDLRLKSADHIKFLSVIIPEKKALISAAIKYMKDETGLNITATLTKDEKACLKMKATFV